MPELLNKVCQHIAVAHQVQAEFFVVKEGANFGFVEKHQRSVCRNVQTLCQLCNDAGNLIPKQKIQHNYTLSCD